MDEILAGAEWAACKYRLTSRSFGDGTQSQIIAQ